MERFHRRPLKIAGLSGIPKWIKLQGLPVDEQEIATSEKVKRWNYLEGIAKEISSNTDISVGLLIGVNCAKALEPKELISSRENGPYCSQDNLWLVCGWASILYR